MKRFCANRTANGGELFPFAKKSDMETGLPARWAVVLE
jgi:hypothetical protein